MVDAFSIQCYELHFFFAGTFHVEFTLLEKAILQSPTCPMTTYTLLNSGTLILTWMLIPKRVHSFLLIKDMPLTKEKQLVDHQFVCGRDKCCVQTATVFAMRKMKALEAREIRSTKQLVIKSAKENQQVQ